RLCVVVDDSCRRVSVQEVPDYAEGDEGLAAGRLASQAEDLVVWHPPVDAAADQGDQHVAASVDVGSELSRSGAGCSDRHILVFQLGDEALEKVAHACLQWEES